MTKVKSTVRANIMVNPIPIFPFMFDFVVINIELLFLFFICFHFVLSYDPKQSFPWSFFGHADNRGELSVAAWRAECVTELAVGVRSGCVFHDSIAGRIPYLDLALLVADPAASSLGALIAGLGSSNHGSDTGRRGRNGRIISLAADAETSR